MEALTLSEVENRYYWELFQMCDSDGSGILSGQQVSDLLSMSGLSAEIVHQVIDACGAKRVGHFGRAQFFVALKLIAAAQNGLPVVLDICNSGRELPLPRFPPELWAGRVPAHTYNHPGQTIQGHGLPMQSLQHAHTVQGLQYMQQSVSNTLPHGQPVQTLPHQPVAHGQPIPTIPHGQSIQALQHGQQISNEQQYLYYDRMQPTRVAPIPQIIPNVGVVSSNSAAPPIRPYHNQRSMSLAIGSDSQAPISNISTERSSPSPPLSPPLSRTTEMTGRKQSAPAVSHSLHHHLAGVAPHPVRPVGGTSYTTGFDVGTGEHRMDKGWASFEDDNYQAGLIPGNAAVTGERKEWAQFADPGKADTLSISSESTTDDAWSITDEQREYYVTQFKMMQEDVRGVISGGIAKEFFEKSKLPIQELSKIWQLSDVNRDGALSLEEFCTAMHLVVLRRNDIELPDTLPPVLVPYSSLINSDEPFSSDLAPGSTLKRTSPTSSISSQQWTKAFQQPSSPTSSSVSSPSNKPTPVNFEFRPITADSDSRIVYPVALRMSPDGQPYMEPSGIASEHSPAVNGGSVTSDPHSSATTKESSVTSPGVQPQTAGFAHILVDLGLDPSEEDSTQHHVTGGVVGQLGGGALHGRPRPTPKKSISGPSQDVLKMLPPPPINQDPFATPTDESLPPVPPPRANATNHSRSASLDNQLIDFSDAGGGATGGHRSDYLPPPVPHRSSPKDISFGSSSGSIGGGEGVKNYESPTKKSVHHISRSLDRNDLQSAIRNQRERNMVLSRLNNELNQELQEVMEQRIALEIQMEHLRPTYHS